MADEKTNWESELWCKRGAIYLSDQRIGVQGSRVLLCLSEMQLTAATTTFLQSGLMVIRSNTLSSCCLHSTFPAHLPVFYPSGRWSEECMYAEMRVGRIFIHSSLDFVACECGEVNWFSYIFWCSRLTFGSPKGGRITWSRLRPLGTWISEGWSLIRICKWHFVEQSNLSHALKCRSSLIFLPLSLRTKQYKHI